MTLTDYAIDILLIGLVLLQVRGRRLTARAFLVPIVVVAYAADNYLKAVPTGGNDLVLIIGCSVLGALIGGLCALFTSVKRDRDGVPIAKAGIAAAVLWVLGVGARFAFQLYASDGGGPAIQRFSVAHHITSIEAWSAALILMAIAEVAARTGGILLRAYSASRSDGAQPPAPRSRAMMSVGEHTA
ncbi:MAG TPA: hypothetical protein VEJ84_01705 [Acidimicrobiales bacterium]|nr:hypothetical protein [Acidimicrobiales bacterium]